MAATAPASASTSASLPAITGPLTIGDLLDRIFRVYRARFGTLVLTAAVMLVPLALLTGLTTGQFMVGYFELLQNLTTTTTPSTGPLVGAFALYALGILGLALLGVFANGIVNLAITVHVSRFYEGRLLSVREGLRRAWPRLWHVVLLYLVQAVAIFAVTVGIMLAVILVFVAAGFLLGGAAFFLFQDNDVVGPLAFVGVMVLIVCGYALLLVLIGAPVLYLSARWIVAVPSLVNEGLGPIAALRRSWHLTTRNVWRCVIYLFLLFVLSTLVVSLPLAVLQQIVLVLLPLSESVGYSLSAGISALFNVVWQPLYATGMVLLYFDLRVRRESFDLDRRVAQMESELPHNRGDDPADPPENPTENPPESSTGSRNVAFPG